MQGLCCQLPLFMRWACRDWLLSVWAYSFEIISNAAPSAFAPSSLPPLPYGPLRLLSPHYPRCRVSAM